MNSNKMLELQQTMDSSTPNKLPVLVKINFNIILI